MQLSVCFVLASSLLACLSYLYERSSEINYLLHGAYIICLPAGYIEPTLYVDPVVT